MVAPNTNKLRYDRIGTNCKYDKPAAMYIPETVISCKRATRQRINKQVNVIDKGPHPFTNYRSDIGDVCVQFGEKDGLVTVVNLIKK